MIDRRQFTVSAAASAALGWSATARAQAFDQARIICPYPPGGTSDALSRRIADKLRGNYARTVIVENKPGAAGQIGIVATRDSPADGSVMLLVPASPLTISPFTYKKLPYDPLQDLVPVSLACGFDHAIGVGPAVPASVKTLNDLLAWFKANPGQAAYGSPASGSMPHLIAALLGKFTNTDMRHVPYRGSAPGIQDLMGGQLAAMCSPLGEFLAHLKTGRIRILAVSGPKRSSHAPAVPTLREVGFPIAMREWYGIFMPAKTPAAVASKASAYLQVALSQPDLRGAMAQAGMDLQPSSPQALGDLLKADMQDWRRSVKTLDFTAES